MKVLMTTDTVGGVWHYAMDHTACLQEERIEVILVAMGPEPNEIQQSQLNKLNVKFYHHPYKLEWMDDPWKDIEKANQWMQEIYKKEKPDLLHFNNYAQVPLNWEVPTILVAHSCVASWWQSVKKEPLPYRYNRYFNLVKDAFHQADMVVSPTQTMLNTYQEIYGPLSNATVIYNGLEVKDQAPKPDKKPIIFSMGRIWDEAKNISLMLKAADAINGKINIAGNQEEGSFEPPANVTFLGELGREEIFNWLKTSSIYLLPVKYEPFGLSFLEASLHKCALIGGDIPTLREIWKESMTYVDTNNAMELAKACNTLLNNEKYCKSMGEEAYRNGRQYSLTKKKELYINLYNKALQTAPDHSYN